MKFELAQPARGFTEFCDDIRQEAGGKVTLVGAYGAALVVHGSFPATLPKLCLYVTYLERIGAVSGPAQLRVYFPGDHLDTPTISSDFPIDQIRSDARAAPLPPLEPGEDSDPTFAMRLPLILTPCEIKQAGAMRVRMLLGDTMIRCGSLRISSILEEPEAEKP